MKSEAQESSPEMRSVPLERKTGWDAVQNSATAELVTVNGSSEVVKFAPVEEGIGSGDARHMATGVPVAQSVVQEVDSEGSFTGKGDVESHWMEERHGDHSGLYVAFLRKYYFPFILKYSLHIWIAWVAVAIVCAVTGLKFLDNTRSNLSLPPGVPSQVAIDAFQRNYPDVSTWAPAFVVQKALAKQDLTQVGLTKTVSTDLADFAIKHKETVSNVFGYWEFMSNPTTKALASGALSDDKTTMVTTVLFQKNATLSGINRIVDLLFQYGDKQSTKDVSVGTTGIFPLFRQMSAATKTNMELIDAVVLPIAVFILGLTLRSYRHIVIALCTLGCSLILSFAIMVPISDASDINPFAPSVMMSLGIAICFDYTLFMTTRFREERLVNFKSKQDAVFESLAAAGHVVVLSGLTLFCTFIILVFFPQNFLQSVGYGCSITVICTIFCNMTLTPALLIHFDCLSFFDCAPSRTSFCCMIPKVDPATVAYEVRQLAGPTQSSARTKPGKFFYVAYWVTKWPIMTLIVFAGVTAPFMYRFLQLNPTSDDKLIYLQESSSLNTLDVMKKSFSEGSLDPYSIIVSGGGKNSVFTQAYFDVEADLVKKLIDTQGAYMNAASVTALSFFQSKVIPFSTAIQYFTPGSALYMDAIALAYRVKVGGLLNGEKSTSRVQIETIVNPNTDLIKGFVYSVRDILKARSKKTEDMCKDPTAPGFCMYLFGGYTTTLDIQNALYAMVPLEIGLICAIVLIIIGINFGSVALALRLAITVFTSLAWTFGLMEMVYQPGPSQDAFAVITPSIKISSGVYWIIPIMSFSILVGLALDYDIFLMSRVVEFRQLGWSDAASVSLAVDKTAGIITAAGCIMAISFAGLLIPKTVVLNQYGFSLFIGVVLDTFVVRTLLVPAVVTAFSVKSKSVDLNWWPYKMPAVILSPAEEYRALIAGYLTPVFIPEGQTDVEDAPPLPVVVSKPLPSQVLMGDISVHSMDDQIKEVSGDSSSSLESVKVATGDIIGPVGPGLAGLQVEGGDMAPAPFFRLRSANRETKPSELE